MSMRKLLGISNGHSLRMNTLRRKINPEPEPRALQFECTPRTTRCADGPIFIPKPEDRSQVPTCRQTSRQSVCIPRHVLVTPNRFIPTTASSTSTTTTPHHTTTCHSTARTDNKNLKAYSYYCCSTLLLTHAPPKQQAAEVELT